MSTSETTSLRHSDSMKQIASNNIEQDSMANQANKDMVHNVKENEHDLPETGKNHNTGLLGAVLALLTGLGLMRKSKKNKKDMNNNNNKK